MFKRLLLFCFALITFHPDSHAIEITRYVAEGATGDGLTKETPAGSLLKVLNLSKQVEKLTVYLAPGTYRLPPLEDANIRTEYRNVSLYGGWSAATEEQTIEKSVITGDLFVNGGLVSNIDFRGSKIGNNVEGYLEGALTALGCNVYDCKATRLEMQAVGGSVSYLIRTEARCTSISPYRSGMQKPKIIVNDCNFSDGLGLSANNVKAIFENCHFNNNQSAGLSLYSCEGTILKRCRIIGNKGEGGVCVKDLTDDFSAIFDQCIISNNTTGNSEYASALTTHAPVLMQNCLIAGNGSDLVASGSNIPDRHQGAVELNRSQSLFRNCTFYGNKNAAIYYNMTPADHSRTGNGQFINCVFLKNGQPFVNKYGNAPAMYYCAADFGSDIPELDAERKIIRIDGNSAKMSVISNENIILEEGSPLINAGRPIGYNDAFGISHLLLGGTDLGYVEYTGGPWHRTSPEVALAIGKDKYVKMESTYDGKSYYIMVQEKDISENGVPNMGGSIDLGDNIADIKVLDESHVITYRTLDGKKTALLYDFDAKSWQLAEIMPYTSLRPTAVKSANGWKLKQGTATPAKAKTQPRRTQPRRK